MTRVLKVEVEAFNERLDELLSECPGQYILIKGTEVLGKFPTQSEAMESGYRRFVDEPFLVRKVMEPVPITLASAVVRKGSA